MKKVIQTGLVISLIFLSEAIFGQTQMPMVTNPAESGKTAKTYLDLMINVVATNLNYGGANSSLNDYKKSNNGLQVGASFQAGITPCFSPVTELYFMKKGEKQKAEIQ